MELLYSVKDGLGISEEEVLQGHAPIPKYRALFLDSIAREAAERGASPLSRSRDFKDIISSFSSVFFVDFI